MILIIICLGQILKRWCLSVQIWKHLRKLNCSTNQHWKSYTPPTITPRFQLIMIVRMQGSGTSSGTSQKNSQNSSYKKVGILLTLEDKLYYPNCNVWCQLNSVYGFIMWCIWYIPLCTCTVSTSTWWLALLYAWNMILLYNHGIKVEGKIFFPSF